jgi:hypothetical protein
VSEKEGFCQVGGWLTKAHNTLFYEDSFQESPWNIYNTIVWLKWQVGLLTHIWPVFQHGGLCTSKFRVLITC